MARQFRTPVAAMTPQQKEWFATAMVTMVLADGNVTREEVDSLLGSISFVKNDQVVANLKKFVQYQTLPQLPAFVGWDKQVRHRACIMLDLMEVAIADRDFSAKEKEQFIHIGRLLGFPPSKVEELIAMGHKAMEGMGG